MGIGHGIQGSRRPEGLTILVLYTDDLLGVGVDHQVHALPGKLIVHLEELALIRDGGVLAHMAAGTMVEQLIEPGGQGAQGAYPRQILLVALQRGLSFQAPMGRSVIDGFSPRPKAGVEIIEVPDLGRIQLTQELIPKGAVPPLELAFSLRRIGTAVDQVDA